MGKEVFYLHKSKECAKYFYNLTKLGVSISSSDGEIIYEEGFCCSSCQMCTLTNFPQSICKNTHAYSMIESSRFGGKYIYLGPLGFTFLVSPIIENNKPVAKITIGPFLMVDRQDYIDCELISGLKLSDDILTKAINHLDNIAFVSPDKVSSISELLSMVIGSITSVSDYNNLLNSQKSYSLQCEVSSHIHEFKDLSQPQLYPIDIEDKMLYSIANNNRADAQKYLNEILGYIFFSTGNNLLISKSRVYEILVLISRTAIKNGSDTEKCLALTHSYLQIIPTIDTIDDLSIWLSDVMHDFMDNLFDCVNPNHSKILYNVIQHIQLNFSSKITLDDIAQSVFLSPSYLSRIFKQETGITFSNFLNNLRIEKSKYLLLHTSDKLACIAIDVGFEDQSYFTKVFKKHTGLSPYKFREKYRNHLLD